ncbi:MAG: hypothetical protein JWQ49_2221 [Edaphobacter sp.]|nr:hypothetical protein [Edaphobacter sp.]
MCRDLRLDFVTTVVTHCPGETLSGVRKTVACAGARRSSELGFELVTDAQKNASIKLASTRNAKVLSSLSLFKMWVAHRILHAQVRKKFPRWGTLFPDCSASLTA